MKRYQRQQAKSPSDSSALVYRDSMEKLLAVLRICETVGVHTAPLRIPISQQQQDQQRRDIPSSSPPASLPLRSTAAAASIGRGSVVVVPLISWHTPDFDNQSEAYPLTQDDLQQLEGYMDQHFCAWPDYLPDVNSVAEHLLDMNQEFVAKNSISRRKKKSPPPSDDSNQPRFGSLEAGCKNICSLIQDEDLVISFSHFVPRHELIPDRKFLTFKALHRVAGNVKIDDQLREIGSSIHVFGHT